ncbi:adenosylcobinamide-GDP ribazoletransferase [Spirochaeta cellobiosiphila]|uniref:adenosylcobinamide-GDP ribazoletransferase n=1 Tax=Spirochaeta cellobiosiphila TaxID=504483 RepID=UPI00040FDEE5|nr:adenosylcobinamide-GDP ribazoletransferase [Spirochaeta cellobiosiphila]
MNKLLLAIQFYTRIPIPFALNYSKEETKRATKYLSLIGLIPALVMILTYHISLIILNTWSSLILSLITSTLVTGAFHEDGFIDSLDGLGGGWTKEDKLKIMKDSRVGSYGLIGYVLMILLKLSLYAQIKENILAYSFILVSVLARQVPITLTRFLNYVRGDETSKSNQYIDKLSFVDHGTAWVITILISLGAWQVLLKGQHFLLLLPIITLIVLIILIAFYYKKQLGGYTGDLLGASEQISEIYILLSIISITHFFY